MKRPTSTTVPDSLIGELRSLVRLYRGGSVFPHGGAPDGVEAAVVLGAQILPGGRPSETLRSRVEHAAQLYAQGRVRLIIPTGGVGKHPPSEAEVAASILQEAGVPTEAILLEEEARNTRESARMVATMARERGIRSLVLVTDPLHCVRTIGVFRAEGLPVSVSPVYSSPMWQKEGMRRGQFLREIAALFWYKVRWEKATQGAR